MTRDDFVSQSDRNMHCARQRHPPHYQHQYPGCNHHRRHHHHLVVSIVASITITIIINSARAKIILNAGTTVSTDIITLKVNIAVTILDIICSIIYNMIYCCTVYNIVIECVIYDILYFEQTCRITVRSPHLRPFQTTVSSLELSDWFYSIL